MHRGLTRLDVDQALKVSRRAGERDCGSILTTGSKSSVFDPKALVSLLMPKLWNKVSEKLRQALPEGSREDILSEVQGFVTRGGALAIRSSDSLALFGLQQDYGPLVENIALGLGFDGAITYELSAEVPVHDGADEEHIFVDPRTQLSLFDVPESAIETHTSEVREDQAALRIDSFDDAKMRMAGLDGGAQARGSSEQRRLPSLASEGLFQEAAAEAGLQLQYSLESWIHGTENVFAFGSAKAISEGDQSLGNLLFIQGGTGMGKTHLLQAIGLAALRRQPTLRVRYMRAETFLNEFLEAIQHRETKSFRRKTRSDVDLLLIDDVDFLRNKSSCQEELLHALNDLVHAQKFVVMTSSVRRDDLLNFDAKLLSRMASGLTVSIDPASEESRLAILQQQVHQQQARVSSDVLEFVARTVRSNTAELLGHFGRILSFGRITRNEISLDVARNQLDQSYKQEQVKVTMDAIIDATVEYYMLKPADIIGRGRTKRVVRPRKVAMFLGRTLTEMSFPELGRYFDNRDHTTVLDACSGIEAELNEDRELRAAIKTIERRLGVG